MCCACLHVLSLSDFALGGAVATGDGDVMMRFLPAYQAVENLRQGMSPDAAAADALQRIVKRHPGTSDVICCYLRFVPQEFTAFD